MADKVQINPLITTETREALRGACQARGMAQGDIVELALVAFLTPADAAGVGDRLLQRLTGVEDVLAQVVELLQAVLDHPAAEGKAPAPAVSIATYEQMYGPIVEAYGAADAPPRPPARPKGWWRWFTREARV